MIRKHLILTLAAWSLTAISQAACYNLPGIARAPLSFPSVGIRVPLIAPTRPVLPLKLPSVPLPSVSIGLPTIQLPSPTFPLPAVPAVFSPAAPVMPAARAAFGGNKVSLHSLNKAFDNAGQDAKPAVSAAPSDPETQEGTPVIRKTPKHLTLPEWELEAEIGQP